MKKRIGIIIVAVLILSCTLLLAACGETYQITLDYAYDSKTETVDVADGSVLTMPVPQRDGYSFNGWYDAAGQQVASVITITGGGTYTAQWTRTGAVAISFEVPEGATAVASLTQHSGDTITLPQGEELDDKVFISWQNQFGQQFDGGATFTVGNEATYTFSAIYKTQVTVVYSISLSGATAPASKNVYEGDNITVAAAPEVDGYTFQGWTYGGKQYIADAILAAQAGATGRMVFTAVYAKNVTLNFMVGGSLAFSLPAIQGQSVSLPDYTLPNGQLLKGWKINGGEQVSAIGSAFTVPAADETFVAETATAYLVTFFAEDNTTIVDSQWVEEGSNAISPAYTYPQSPSNDQWYLTYTGLSTYENITTYTNVYPNYEYVPSDSSLFEFTAVGDAYTVRYSNYKSGMGTYDITDLKLPAEYLGKPVIGLTTNTSTSNSDSNIKKGGFALSSKLKRIYIPSSYQYLANLGFAKNTALEEVVFAQDSQLQTINQLAFAGCTSLQSIEIPGSVSLMGKQAFISCPKLSNITFQESTTPLEFADEALGLTSGIPKIADKGSLVSFQFPARTTKIGARVFKYNAWLQEITFENNGTAFPLTIGDNAFNAFTSNASNSISSVFYPSAVTEIEIPSRTISIGANAFAAQIYIEQLTFADGINLKTFGNYAFAHLISLKSIELPDTLTSLPTGAFARANGAYKYYSQEAKSITPKDGEFGYNECNLACEITLPDGMTSIGASAFYQQHKITEINFANTIEEIGQNAFFCTVEFNKQVKKVEYPTSLKTLGNNNFTGYVAVTSVEINCPELKVFSGFSFSTGTELAEMTVKFTDITSLEEISRNSFNNASIKSITFGNYVPTAELSIMGNVFAGNHTPAAGMSSPSTFTTVEIPANVVYIDSTAFKFVKSFTSFTVDADNTNYMAIDGVLYYIGEAEEQVLANVPQGITESLTIPEGTTAIGENAFRATDIQSVNIAGTVKEIGANAFYAAKLQSINIPTTVNLVGANAFSYSDIVMVICNAKEISNAFNNCSSLQYIELGESVQTVASSFAANNNILVNNQWTPTKLVSIVVKGATTKTMSAGTVFYSTDKVFKIIVDNDTLVSTYSAMEGWKEVAETFTTGISITMGETSVTIGKGGRLAPFQIPQDETGYVWLTPDYNEISSTMVFNENTILLKAFKVDIITNDNVQTLYVAEGNTIQSYLPDVTDKVYFDDNGEEYITESVVTRSMTLQAQEFATVTFVNGNGTNDLTIKVEKGTAIPSELIPTDANVGYFWTTEQQLAENAYKFVPKDDTSAEFDKETEITENISLYKLIYVTFVDDTSNNVAGSKVQKVAVEIGSRITKNVKENGDPIEIVPSMTKLHSYINKETKEDIVPAPTANDNRAWVTDANYDANTRLFDFQNTVFNTATNIYIAVVSDISFTYEDKTVVYSWSIGGANAPKSVLQIVPDAGENRVWVNNKDVIWDFTTQLCNSSNFGNAFTAKEIVTITFVGSGEPVQVIKGNAVDNASIPSGGVWCTVAEGTPTEWEASSKLTESIMLYKYLRLTFKSSDESPTTKEFLVADGQTLTTEQLLDINALIKETEVWFNANSNEVSIDAATTFSAGGTYTATVKELVTVTFVGGLDNSNKEIQVVKGSKISSSDIPSDPASGYVWVISESDEMATPKEFNSNTAVTGDLTLVKRIKITVTVSAAAAEDNTAIDTVKYFAIDEESVTLATLKANYGYVNAEGQLLTADEIAAIKTNSTQSFTAVQTKTYTVILDNGTTVEKIVIA